MEIVVALKKIHGNFIFIGLNGLKLQKPSMIYSDLFHSIFGEKPNPEIACKALGRILSPRPLFFYW